MPVLAACTPMSVATRLDLPRDDVRWDFVKSLTPSEFWTVTVVTATSGCTPSSANVRRSACRPAPPPESDPAMESTRTGVRRGGVRGRNVRTAHPTPARSMIEPLLDDRRGRVSHRRDAAGWG